MTIQRLSKKAGFVVAVAGAAIVGGAATALVSAAIPSTADGQIHGCYRNNAGLTDAKGTLRVIDDQSGQSCTGQETALSLSAEKLGYVNFKVDPLTGDVSVGNTHNITTVTPASNNNFCVKVSFAPKTASTSGGPQAPIEVRGVSTEEDADIDNFCDSNYNALVPAVGFSKATFTGL